MTKHPLETGWRDWLALYSDIFGVVGGLVLIIGFLSWLFSWLSSPVLLVCGGASLALICVWIIGHVFVSNNQSLQTIGRLGSNESEAIVGARVSSEPRRSAPLDELSSQALADGTSGTQNNRSSHRIAEVRAEWKRLTLSQRRLVQRLFVLDELCGSQITDYLKETGIYQKTKAGVYLPGNLLSDQIPVDYLLENSPLLERKDSDGGEWFRGTIRLDNVYLSWYSNCYWRLRPDLLEAVESVIDEEWKDNAQIDLETRGEKPAEPKPSFKFGVSWDKELNPLCPHCGAHLSNPQYIVQRRSPSISRFICQNCMSNVSIEDENGFPLRYKEAKERMTILDKPAEGGD